MALLNTWTSFTCRCPGPSQPGKQAWSGCSKCGGEPEDCPPPDKKMKSSAGIKESVVCTYCDIPVPAQKTCLHCEASFCAKHLEKHNMWPEHDLSDPTPYLVERKCSKHKMVLKYCCVTDKCYFCVSCCAAGDHKGHKVESLQVCANKKKDDLKRILEALKVENQNAEKQISTQLLHDKSQEQKAEIITGKITAKTQHIIGELNALERKVLNELSTKRKLVSRVTSLQIGLLEARKKEISRKIEEVMELCNLTDPLTFLILEGKRDFTRQPAADQRHLEISETRILQMQHAVDNLIKQLLQSDPGKVNKSEITLDKKTAHGNISVSDDLKTAYYSLDQSGSQLALKTQENEERFKSPYVTSICSFSSGNHYWEVDLNRNQKCIIGVAYRSLVQKAANQGSCIGLNDKSWGVYIDCSERVLRAYHNCTQCRIPTDSSESSFGISLKYEAGRLTFYQLTNPRRHLHSFTVTFTEPLHAAFYLYEGSGISIRE